MNLSFLGPLLGAAMGARHKQHLGARGMIGLAGLAAAAYYALRSNSGPSFGGAPPIVTQGTTVVRGSATPPSAPPAPPPLPEVLAQPGVQRILRLVISAARCDGTLGEEERAAILKQAREIGAEGMVESELARPVPLSQIVAGVSDPNEKEALYVLGYTIVRADTDVNGAERVFLVQLANLLALDAGRVQSIENDVAARIAAAG